MSNDLNLLAVADNQNNKEATINTNTDQLGNVISDFLAVDLTSGNVTLTSSQFRNYMAYSCSGHTVPRVLTVPAYKRYFVVDNRGTGTGTVTVTLGSGTVVVAIGTRASIWTDGTASGIYSVSTGGATTVTSVGTTWAYPFRGALVNITADFAGHTASATMIPWTAAAYDTTFQPNDTGGVQRFWLGANFTYATTDVDTTNEYITKTGHGFVTGEGPFFFTTSGTLPAGLALATKYWAITIDANTFAVATSRANALASTKVNITGVGTGTHTCDRGSYLVVPAGVTYVKLVGQMGADSDLAGFFSSIIQKNGAAAYGGSMVLSDTATSLANNVASAVVSVTEGDYFTLTEQGADAYTLSGDQTRTWFAIEVIQTNFSASPPKDIDLYIPGTPTVSVNAASKVTGRAFNLPINLTGSAAYADTQPSGGSVVFDIQQNGVSKGSMTFADGAHTATFTFAAAINFVAADRLALVAPGNLRSMANISVSLVGTYT